MRRNSRLKSLRYSPKKPKKGFVMGFPPYNVVEMNGDFKYHHSGMIPTFGVKVIIK